MNSATLLADKRPLEMDSQDLGVRLIRFVLLGDVRGDPLDGPQSLIRAGRNSSGDERRSAVFRNLASDSAERGCGSFHDVVAAGAVDMHVNETRDGCLVCSANFPCSRGQGHPRAWPDGFDGVIAK